VLANGGGLLNRSRLYLGTLDADAELEAIEYEACEELDDVAEAPT
jgi:hypothetical protein